MQQFTGNVAHNEGSPGDPNDYFFTDPEGDGSYVPCTVFQGMPGGGGSQVDLSGLDGERVSLDGEYIGHYRIVNASNIQDLGPTDGSEHERRLKERKTGEPRDSGS
jgi:hypothetical protein